MMNASSHCSSFLLTSSWLLRSKLYCVGMATLGSWCTSPTKLFSLLGHPSSHKSLWIWNGPSLSLIVCRWSHTLMLIWKLCHSYCCIDRLILWDSKPNQIRVHICICRYCLAFLVLVLHQGTFICLRLNRGNSALRNCLIWPICQVNLVTWICS